jgi:hypothetical protein
VRQGRWIWAGCTAVSADGTPLDAAEVVGVLPADGRVVLTVKADRLSP